MCYDPGGQLIKPRCCLIKNLSAVLRSRKRVQPTKPDMTCKIKKKKRKNWRKICKICKKMTKNEKENPNTTVQVLFFPSLCLDNALSPVQAITYMAIKKKEVKNRTWNSWVASQAALVLGPEPDPNFCNFNWHVIPTHLAQSNLLSYSQVYGKTV